LETTAWQVPVSDYVNAPVMEKLDVLEEFQRTKTCVIVIRVTWSKHYSTGKKGTID